MIHLAPHPSVGRPALPTTFTVRIDPEDILLGKPGNSWHCPIARAWRRQLVLTGLMPPHGDVYVSSGDGRIFQRGVFGSKQKFYRHDAAGFISTYDAGKPVESREVHFTAI